MPDLSKANVKFDNFQYRVEGEMKSYSGDGLLFFRKRNADNRWVLESMNFEKGDQLLDEFRPPETIYVDP